MSGLYRLWPLGLLALLPLVGCEKFSTAATMRVEVEVYKGPLSKDPETQMGELVGLVGEAADALGTLREAVQKFKDRVAPASERVDRFHWENIEGDLGELIGATRNLRIASNAWMRRYYPSFQSRIDSRGPQPTSSASTDEDHYRKYYEELAGSLGLGSIWKVRIFHAEDDPPRLGETNACSSISHVASKPDTIDRSADEARRLVWIYGELIRYERSELSKKEAALETARNDLKNAERSVHWLFSWRQASDDVRSARALVEYHELNYQDEKNRLEFAIRSREWAIQRSEQLEEERQCATMPSIVASTGSPELVPMRDIRERLRGILMQTSQLAERYRAKALLWAEAHVGIPPSTERARWAPATFSTLTSQYADKLTSKADSLLKQVKGDDRRELPLSIALRESSPPDFLKLYVWNYAASSLPVETLDWTRGVQEPQDRIRDRVKVIERLFTDGSWTKVNTVYAGGQGTVRMALIKDDVGNWNLKSFDNDPTKLLEAYKNVGYAALSTATQAIAAASSGGASEAVNAALQVANKVALGSGAAGGGSDTSKTMMTELRADLTAQLRTLDQSAKDRVASLDRSIDQDGTAVGEKEQTLRDQQAKVCNLQGQRDAADDLDRKSAATTAAAEAISEVANSAPAGMLEALRAQIQQKRSDSTLLKSSANEARAKSEGLEMEKEKLRQLNDAVTALKTKLSGLKAERAEIAKATLEKARQALEQYRSTLDSMEASVVSRVENKVLDKLQEFVPKARDVFSASSN